MSGFSAVGFPGMMPGAPGTAAPPGAPGMQGSAGFVLDIPADPTWEPFDFDDVLEQDGYYAGRIKSERFVEGKNNNPGGVWFAIELLDSDVAGKTISRQLQDPRATTKDAWHQWRSLFRAVYGMDAARASTRYSLGMLAGQQAQVHVRTGAFVRSNGNPGTGIDAWVTKEEYDKAVHDKKHRWAPKPRQPSGGMMGSPGALPAGLPPAFPGMGAPLPGAPSAPVGFPTAAPSVPQPAAAAPMQGGFAPPPQPTQTAQQPAPMQMAPAQAAPPPPASPWNTQPAAGMQPPPQQTAQGFAPPAPAPTGFAPAAPTGFAPPAPTPGQAPPPANTSAFPGFPGGPPPQYPPHP